MNDRNYTYFPDAEHRFFLIDPSNQEFLYFKTMWERNVAADDMIHSHLDDGWSEEVDQIIAGEVTHHTVMCDVNPRPRREDFDTDDDYNDAMSDYGNPEYPYTCNYELAPLEEEGDKNLTNTDIEE